MDPAEARRLLGVGPDAAPDAVRRAYRARARSAHPDAGGSWNEMAELNEAYRLLGRGGEPPEPAPGEPAPGEPAWPSDIDDPFRVDEAVGSGMSRQGFALVVLAGLCALAIVVVFVAAVGYDWSVGTR